MAHDELIPAQDQIYAWIEQVFAQGVRRPGYPADRWAERFCQERLRQLGLENVRAEPVELPYWEPGRCSLTAWPEAAPGDSLTFEGFPLPHATPASGLEGTLAPYDYQAPGPVNGNIALVDVRLGRMPHAALSERATFFYDPDGTLAESAQVLPFGRGAQAVMEPAIEAGAIGFVGTLSDYPSDSRSYYVPYDGIERPIPGLWLSGSDGARLRELLAAGPARVRLVAESVRRPETSYNIVGELPGADEETVIIGSHHDGPWASAVEDGSGIALVLAQAEYWSRVPQSERPHRLIFLINAGHMAGGAGVHAFIAAHEAELAHVVLEIHLEHAANECVEENGVLKPNGLPEARWWFTSLNAELEDAVRDTLRAEGLGRSIILPPDMFGPTPTTDGGPFHAAGVPLVNYLTAPFYLFDEQDTLDKVHKPSLVPVTRAAIRLVEWTAGRSAASMRAGVRPAAAAAAH
ncbi:MAG: M28 family peptidase [Dehalococcoidia bacterium]